MMFESGTTGEKPSFLLAELLHESYHAALRLFYLSLQWVSRLTDPDDISTRNPVSIELCALHKTFESKGLSGSQRLL